MPAWNAGEKGTHRSRGIPIGAVVFPGRSFFSPVGFAFFFVCLLLGTGDLTRDLGVEIPRGIVSALSGGRVRLFVRRKVILHIAEMWLRSKIEPRCQRLPIKRPA